MCQGTVWNPYSSVLMWHFSWDIPLPLSFHPLNPLPSSPCRAFTTPPRLHFFFCLLPCDIIHFCLYFLRSPSHIFFLSQISVGSFLFLRSFTTTSTLPLLTLSSVSPYPGVFLLYTHTFSLTLFQYLPSLFPPFLPCFFLEDHLDPPLSPLPFIVCHSLSFHPSFFHLNLSQGDLGRAHLLSFSSPSIPFLLPLKSPRPHSYLKIHPFFPSGSIHHSNY